MLLSAIVLVIAACVSPADGRPGILLVGGWQSSDSAELYIPGENGTLLGAKLTNVIGAALLLRNDGRVLVVNGQGGVSTYMNPCTNKTSPGPPPRLQRNGLAAGLVNGDSSLVICGGDNGGGVAYRSCEVLIGESNWVLLNTTMQQGRMDFTLTVTANGAILAAGGDWTESAEYLQDGKWKSIANMENLRQQPASIEVANGGVMVCGGNSFVMNFTQVLNSCQVFDGSSWSEAPALVVPRYAFTLTQLNNTIYAIGGMGGTTKSPAASVEWLDEAEGKWKLMENVLLKNRTSHGAVVLDLDC